MATPTRVLGHLVGDWLLPVSRIAARTTLGPRYWLRVLTEIKNRGVGDVLIGLPGAISEIWAPTRRSARCR